MSNHNGNANKMVSDTLMNDNAPKREIHRLAIALDGVNKGLEAKFCSGEPILTIHPDGRVTTSPRLKPDEISALVLDQIKTAWLKDAQATKIRELQEYITQLENRLRALWDKYYVDQKHYTDRIKRLEEAGDAMAEWLENPRNLGADACLSHAWREAKGAKP